MHFPIPLPSGPLATDPVVQRRVHSIEADAASCSTAGLDEPWKNFRRGERCWHQEFSQT